MCKKTACSPLRDGTAKMGNTRPAYFSEQAPYLTVPSDTLGTDKVTSKGIWHWLRKIDIILRASTSLLGAFTEAQPKYVSLLNTTLSSSATGVKGLGSSHSAVEHKVTTKEMDQRAGASEPSRAGLQHHMTNSTQSQENRIKKKGGRECLKSSFQSTLWRGEREARLSKY